MAPTDMYVATQSFSARLDGRPVNIRAGRTRVRAGHPLLKGREHMFKPVGVDYDIEQTTAAPGEKRKAQLDPYAGLTAADLRGLCQRRGIDYPTNATKKALVELLRAAD